MFISLDLETTGFDPASDKIIEFGAVKFDLSGQKETLQFLVNPGFGLPPLITHITNIKNEDLAKAPPIEEKLEEIKNFIGDLPIIGHNIKFDTEFLKACGLEIQNEEYDTLEFAAILLPSLPSYSLEILSGYLDLEHEEKHRALDDAKAVCELFIKLSEHFKTLDEKLIEKIHNLCEKSSWPFKNFLSTLHHSEKAKKIVQKKEKTEEDEQEKSPEYLEEILNPNKSALFELPSPYDNLALALAEKADKDTYISIPYNLFREISHKFPQKIAQIDLPKNYLSEKRFKNMLKKESFLPNELTALIKILIWKEQTTTGLLSEVSLFREEKEVFYSVCIDENDKDCQEDPYLKKALEKDQKSCAIITHDYLCQAPPKCKNLIIIDFEKFTKSLFFQSSAYIHSENALTPIHTLLKIFPDNETLKTIINKFSILIGLVGILFDKTNNRDQIKPKGFISDMELNTQEWQKLKDTVSNLISTSKDLGPLLNEQTSLYLKTWKKTLTDLNEIFNNPDIKNNLIWIEFTQEKNIIIKKTPIYIKENLKNILKNSQIHTIIGENFELNDNGAFIKNLYGLNEDLPLYQGEIETKPIIYITEDSPENERDLRIISNFLADYFIKNHPPASIVVNSRKTLEQFTILLSAPFQKQKINLVSQLTGSLNKLNEKFKQDKENSVILVTPNAFENLKINKIIPTLIIHKIPFDPPSDPHLMALSQNFKNPFMELQVPRAILNLKKLIKTSSAKKIILLDSRLVSKDYSEQFLKNLRGIGETKIVKISSLVN